MMRTTQQTREQIVHAIAEKAVMRPVTIARFIAGLPTKPLIARRIETAAAELGYRLVDGVPVRSELAPAPKKRGRRVLQEG